MNKGFANKAVPQSLDLFQKLDKEERELVL